METPTETADKSVVLSMRTTPEASEFVGKKATRLKLTKNDVMKKMFTYAAKHMSDEDYQ